MSFTIFLNSNNGDRVTIGTNNQLEYDFDFTIPSRHSGQYKLSYSFLSQGGMTLTTSDILYITMSLPMTMENYSAGLYNGASKTQYLGFINNKINTNGLDCYFYKNFTDTSPTIIQKIPTSQEKITISLYNAVTGVLDAKLSTNQYSLVLFFEAI